MTVSNFVDDFTGKTDQLDALDKARSKAVEAVYTMLDIVEAFCPAIGEKASRSWVNKILEALGETQPSFFNSVFSHTYQDTLQEIFEEMEWAWHPSKEESEFLEETYMEKGWQKPKQK